MKWLAMSVLCVLPLAGQAQNADVTIKYYDVDALVPAGMRVQMKARGPQGFWGYASWYVAWTGSCSVTVTGEITFPRHTRPEKMTAENRQIWEEMTTALMEHEMTHISHGESAAREIKRNNCNNGDDTIRKWNREDEAYDKRTDHGFLEGVNLIPG